MRGRKKSIGPIPVPGRRLSAGIGYAVIPSDVDRDQYIKQCYRTGTILMYTEDQEVIRDVSVDEEDIQSIIFPEIVNDLGSAVVWVLLPLKRQPVVVSVIMKPDESLDIQEHQRKIRKQTDFGLAEISLRGDKGIMSFTIDAEESDGGQLNVRVQNANSTAQMNLFVRGKATIEATDRIDMKAINDIQMTIEDPSVVNSKTTIQYKRGEGFSYIDEFKNTIKIINGQVSIDSKKFVLNNGGQPMVLGDALKSLLDDFITATGSITTATLIGASPIINKAQIDALKTRSAQILSKLGFLD